MLFNFNYLICKYLDCCFGEIMVVMVDFFEFRGKVWFKYDDYEWIWYLDFLDFVGWECIFVFLLMLVFYGVDDCCWDIYWISEFVEIMGFYGLSYWYFFQVIVLGLGLIWMSVNEDVKCKVVVGFEVGEVFVFGLFEQIYGVDVYQIDMIFIFSDGGWIVNGEKYYIGNVNVVWMVFIFGKIVGILESQEYVFFVVDFQYEWYDLIKNVVNLQNYVVNYVLCDYLVIEVDILYCGVEVFYVVFNMVNVCKYNLGWGVIGMCIYVFYELVIYVVNCYLYGIVVIDFSYVWWLFIDVYVWLIVMKLVVSWVSDYMCSVLVVDCCYLFYSLLIKVKVISEGEWVIIVLWDVIVVKGVEKDMFFEIVVCEIGLLFRLEGIVYINIGLFGKFMFNYLFVFDFMLLVILCCDDVVDDVFLFVQGFIGGLGKVCFYDWCVLFDICVYLFNVVLLCE